MAPKTPSIGPSGASLVVHFVYDDGPHKTVDSTQTISFDAAAATYTELEPGKPAVPYKVTGYNELKSGHGELVLAGAGTDNDKPADVRITLAVRRNLLTWIDEVRPAGGAGALVFRHRYTFTRARVPVVPTK
jgi:hypothetical protein